MPKTATKHESQTPLELGSFMGGMNQGIPPTELQNNECVLIENMFFDRRSGKPRTRYPIMKYSDTAPSTSGLVDSLYYWKSFWIFSCNQTLYYLDSSLNPQSLGTLNSTSKPTYAPYNDKLIVASGGAVQYTQISGVPTALSDLSGGPTAKYVFERYSRLVSAGDPSYPDRIREGTYADETTWNATDYGDVGYKDDTEIVGITEAFEGLYIVFKRGQSGLKTYYCTSLSSTDPQAMLISANHSARTHHGVVVVLGRVFVMEESFISCLMGTEQQGKVIYDQTPGMKLASTFTATGTAFAVPYPRDAQIWFVPDPLDGVVYVYHYLIGAWSKFTFGDRKIHSAYYDASSDYLYLGCDDGFVYKYDRAATSYSDTAGAYTQRILTKVFTGVSRETVVKTPILFWSNLATGTGTFRIRSHYGANTAMSGNFTINTPALYVYDTRPSGDDETYVYDTCVGGDSERYVFPDDTSQEDASFSYNVSVGNFQFDIRVTSGALMIQRIVTEVAEGRRLG